MIEFSKKHVFQPPPWPTGLDGKPKSLDAMTAEERRAQIKWACTELEAQLANPEMRKLILGE